MSSTTNISSKQITSTFFLQKENEDLKKTICIQRIFRGCQLRSQLQDLRRIFKKVNQSDCLEGYESLEKTDALIKRSYLVKWTDGCTETFNDLNVLELSGLNLKNIKQEVLDLFQNSESIDLSNNALSTLSVTFPSKCVFLYLHSNRITEIFNGFLDNCLSIDCLNISNNRIKALGSNDSGAFFIFMR